ncbi:MAG: hypothetical protein JOZ41_00035 [Chloroflexi bacterium]|nr:hypothetical protein [Chloroflexota bacterium]
MRTRMVRHSLSTWLDLHPLVKARATVGAGLGLGTLLAGRSDAGREVRRQVRQAIRRD